MKTIIATLAIVAFALIQVDAGGITFSQKNWNQILQEAKASNKIIFVDFYATWCGPCKQLEKEVFTNDSLGNYFNEHFVNKRIDAEKEELDLVKKLDIRAYPTLIFFDPSGNVLYKIEGALYTDQLVNCGKQASTVYELNQNNTWKANIDNLKIYLQTLETHNPTQAEIIATDYLNALPKDHLRKPENWDLLTEFITDVKNPSWQYVIDNLAYFSREYDAFLLASNFQKLGDVVMKNAIATKNHELLPSKTELDMLIGKVQGDSIITKAQYQHWNTNFYLEGIEDKAGYAASLNTYIQLYHWKDANALTYYASKILNGSYPISANTNATMWAEHSLSIDKENYLTHWVLAIGYSKANNIAKSNFALQNFLRLSKSDPQLPAKFHKLLIDN